jgi:hypothetical protein
VRQSRIVRSLSIAIALALAVLAAVAWHQRSVAQRNEALAIERQHLVEQRLKELCGAWKVTTTFIEENLPAAIYDIKSRLHDTFAFDETCSP